MTNGINEIKHIIFAEGFDYDEDTFIPAGEYLYIENGVNGFDEIFFKGKWLDIVDVYELPWVDIF